jgi:hypothetical protein
MTLTVVRPSATPRDSLAHQYEWKARLSPQDDPIGPVRAGERISICSTQGTTNSQGRWLYFQLGGVCRHHPSSLRVRLLQQVHSAPQSVAISELLPRDYRNASISSVHREFASCRSLVCAPRLTARIPAPGHVPGPKILGFLYPYSNHQPCFTNPATIYNRLRSHKHPTSP